MSCAGPGMSSVAVMSHKSLDTVMSSLLLLFLFSFGGQSQVIPNRYGELQGINLDPAFIGETVVFKCVITDDRLLVNSSSIWIRRSHSYISIGRVVNQTGTSATIEVKVTSLSDAGMYYCTLSTPGRDYGLGYAWVDVDYPPAPVTDLNCTVPPGRTQLGCIYTLPLPYRHPEYILGIVCYYPQNQESRDICYSSLDRNFSLPAGNSLYSNYKFQIKLWHNRRNVSKVSKEFSVRPIDVVIPPPVDNIHVKDRGPRCLHLSWQQIDGFIEHVYRVTYTAVWGNVEQISTVQTQSTDIVLRELSPFTNYSILVQGRERNLVVGYWSNGDPIIVRTLADAPGRAPRVSPAVSGTDDGRVVMYWQPLPPRERNGEMQGYIVQCEDEEERRVGPGRFSLTLDIPSDRRGLLCDVSALNNVGVSPTSSLYIPSRRPELTPREFWVAGGEGHTNITFLWDSGGREQLICTAYWCQAADLANLCQTPVQWETVSCDQQNLTLDTGHVIADQLIIVGFSAQLSAPGGLVWSSIKWQYCVYARNKVPPPPDGFRLSPSQPPLGVHVEWRPPDCRQNPAHITTYLLSYCPVSETAAYCTDSSRSRVVDGDAVSYLIRDLEPGAIYKVKIRAVSQVLQGPWSAPVIGRVEDAASSSKIILAVTGCFSSILVFIFCFQVVKRARSSWNRGHLYSYPPFAPVNAYSACPQVESGEKVEEAIADRGPGHVTEEVITVNEGPGRVAHEAIGEIGPGRVAEEVIAVNEGPGHVSEEAIGGIGPGHVAEEVTAVNGGPGRVAEEVIAVSEGPGHVAEEVTAVNGGPGRVAEGVIAVNEGPGHVAEEVTAVNEGPGRVAEEVIAVNEGPGRVAEEVIAVNEGPGRVAEEVIAVNGGLGRVADEVITVNGGPGHVVGEVTEDGGPGHVIVGVSGDGGSGMILVGISDDSGGTMSVFGEARVDDSVTIREIGPSTPNGTRTHLLKDHTTTINSEYVFDMSRADSHKSPPHSNQSYSMLTLTEES